MDVEKIVLNGKRNVTLTAYTQPVEGEFNHISKRPAVLILPGGGYSMCSDREADPVAFPYLEAGYQAFILRYSVGEDSVWPNPLDDYEQAMALIEERADEWKVLTDKIVVIGFSAGGHLAASAATMSQHRPYAAILGYPVIEGDCAKIYEKTAPDVIARHLLHRHHQQDGSRQHQGMEPRQVCRRLPPQSTCYRQAQQHTALSRCQRQERHGSPQL